MTEEKKSPDHPYNTAFAMALAKCVRNSEIPDPARSRLLRDLCVVMGQVFRGFNQPRFLTVAYGGKIPDGMTKYWTHFDRLRYLNDAYESGKFDKDFPSPEC